MIWNRGKAVGLEEIGELQSLAEEGSKDEICLTHYLKNETRYNLTCQKCGTLFSYVHGNSILICKKCGENLDLNKEQSPKFFRFAPDFVKISEAIVDSLRSAGFEVNVGKKHGEIDHLIEVGNIILEDYTSFRLYLAECVLERTPISELWISLFSKGEYAILINPGISDVVRSIVTLTASSIPILFCPLESIGQNRFVQDAQVFHSFRLQIEGLISSLNTKIPEVPKIEVNEPNIDWLDNIDDLSKTGREKFERPAVNLLSTIGVPFNLKRQRYMPEGLLVIQDGFWIVDAKSSKEGFKFPESERDKADRYTRAFEEKFDNRNTKWNFFGEIIVARTEHIDESYMERLQAHFNSSNLTSYVTILSFEGLIWLWRSALQTPSYWHLIDYQNDPMVLLRLGPVIVKNLDTSDFTRRYTQGRIKLVSDSAIKSYWKYVFDRKEYNTLGLGSPENLINIVQRTILEKFRAGP